jgi:hypothetical protein
MEPLALSLQRLGAFDFCGAESLDLLSESTSYGIWTTISTWKSEISP